MNNNELYWLDRDTTIYALYDKKLFDVIFHTNTPDISLAPQKVAFKEKVYAPTLYRNGYTFKGWFTDSEWKNAFNGEMPPKKLNLYAGWVKE